MTEDELMLVVRKAALEMICQTGSEREATLMALCTRMQAVGLREAAQLYRDWLKPGYKEEMTFEYTLEQKANEREG